MPFSTSSYLLTQAYNLDAGTYLFVLPGTEQPIYIGSSINFLRRLDGHRYDFLNPEYSRGQTKLYDFIRGLNGKDSGIHWGISYKFPSYY